MTDDVTGLVAALEQGDRRTLARLLTLVEDGGAERLRHLVTALHPRTGGAEVVGITGPPGVGKSTLTSEVVGELRARGRTVGVLAVDPSSPFSGGALLGDRVRMQSHHDDDGVFVRSMASRGHTGGLALATPQAVLILDAAGFEVVVIETVGVGQAEISVADSTDSTLVVLAPNMGDSVQAAKAGILEVADVLVVNKCDHGGAGRLETQLRGMLETGAIVAPGRAERSWTPPVLRTVAVRGEGTGPLVDALEDHARHLRDSGRLSVVRRRRARHAVREIALATLRGRLEVTRPPAGSHGEPDGVLLDELAAEVARRRLDPYTAADRLVAAGAGGG